MLCCYIMFCYIILYYVMLYYIILYYIMLYYIIIYFPTPIGRCRVLYIIYIYIYILGLRVSGHSGARGPDGRLEILRKTGKLLVFWWSHGNLTPPGGPNNIILYNMISYCTIWYHIVQYDIILYNMISYCIQYDIIL